MININCSHSVILYKHTVPIFILTQTHSILIAGYRVDRNTLAERDSLQGPRNKILPLAIYLSLEHIKLPEPSLCQSKVTACSLQPAVPCYQDYCCDVTKLGTSLSTYVCRRVLYTVRKLVDHGGFNGKLSFLF